MNDAARSPSARETGDDASPGRGLRICHLGKYYPPATGGVETHVQTLARAQAALGAEVRVVCVNHQDSRGEDVTWKPVATTPTVDERDGDVRVVRVGRRASLSKLDVCPDLLRAIGNVRREGFDVIHVHAPNPTMFGLLSVMPPFGTLVVTHHSDVVKQRVLKLVFTPVERLVHARAKMVLASSGAYVTGSDSLRRLGGKVRTLPLGLELEPFLTPGPHARAKRDELRREHGGTLWLMVGRLVYYKGLTVAIDALRNVPGKLLIVGQGPMRHELEVRARAEGLADRVVFLDYVDHDTLIGAYHAATALWFPSVARSEGFGLSQVEAMAAGCPVINAEVPHSGVAWVSTHEESGLTVPVGDAEALARATRRLLDDDALRARLARGAKARAVSEFDHEIMARRSFALYREALGDGPAPRRDRPDESTQAVSASA